MIDQECGCQHPMTGNTVLPMTFMFLGSRDDFHIAIKAPFLKYILMDKRFGINEEKPGIYEISVQEEEKLQKVLVDVQHEIRDKMNKEEPDSEVFRHLKATDEIIIEMPGDFRPLTLTDAPGTSEGGPMGQWMRDAAAYQKSKAHLELQMVDAGSCGVEKYIKKTEETTEEAQVSNEKGQKFLLLVNKVKDTEHIEEIKKKFQNSKKDQKNVMYTSGMNLLAHRLLQTEKELLSPLSKSEISNAHSAEKQKLLYRAAFGDVQHHKDFVKKWNRVRTFLEEDIEEKNSACDNFALLSFLETAASQHWAKCSERLLEEAAIHYDEMARAYSMKLYLLKGKFDKRIEKLEEFLKLHTQKQMEDLKETKKYKEMKKQLEDGIKILQHPPQNWDLELLRSEWYQWCVQDWRTHEDRVCEMMVSKLFNTEEGEEEEEVEKTPLEVWDLLVELNPRIIARHVNAGHWTVQEPISLFNDLSAAGFPPPVETLLGLFLVLMLLVLLLVDALPLLFRDVKCAVGFRKWGKGALTFEAMEEKIVQASLKMSKENAGKVIKECKDSKAEAMEKIAALELKETHCKMKAAALRKFAKATFGLAHAHIL